MRSRPARDQGLLHMDRRLAVTATQRITDNLLRIDALRDAGVRSLYITELEAELGFSLSARRSDDARVDVYSLVRTCSEYPGALRALVRIVAAFHGGSRAVVELERLVNEVEHPYLMSTEERDALLSLVHGLPAEVVAAAYADIVQDPKRDGLRDAEAS